MGPELLAAVAAIGLLYVGAALGCVYLGWRFREPEVERWEEKHDQLLAKLADVLEDREAGSKAAQAIIEVERRTLAAGRIRDRRERRRLLQGAGAPTGTPTAPGQPSQPGGGDPPPV